MVGNFALNKKKNNRIVSILMTFLWVLTIFSFSFQRGEQSAETSFKCVEWLVNILPLDYLDRAEFVPLEQLNFLLRKLAHFLEFFVLGILINWVVTDTLVRHKVKLELVFCMIVASIDEVIQMFVKGRSAQIVDVMLDCVGALCGIGVVLISRVLLSRSSRISL